MTAAAAASGDSSGPGPPPPLAPPGLPQKCESLSLSRQVMDLAGGIETLRLVHRVAGGTLVLTGVYHVFLMLAAVLLFPAAGSTFRRLTTGSWPGVLGCWPRPASST